MRQFVIFPHVLITLCGRSAHKTIPFRMYSFTCGRPHVHVPQFSNSAPNRQLPSSSWPSFACSCASVACSCVGVRMFMSGKCLVTVPERCLVPRYMPVTVSLRGASLRVTCPRYALRALVTRYVPSLRVTCPVLQ